MALSFIPEDVPQEQPAAAQSPGFLSSLMQKWQDPNVRQAIMQTGLGLMRSPGYGQSGWDVGAQALGTGVETLATLRERDRQRGLLAEDRQIKEQQRGIENNRGDRTVAATERNAATNEKNVTGDQAAKEKDQLRADKALEEAIRHNKSEEEIARLRATADNIRANAYSNYGAGKTPAEVEKLNRLKKFYMEKKGMDETNADKAAFDYLQTAKGKSPRQLVMDTIKNKVTQWYDQQYDPTAKPTPEMIKAWQDEAVKEVQFAEEAGKDVTETQGTSNRPTTPVPGATPPPQAPGAPPAAMAAPMAPAAKSDATLRSIEKWKVSNATPEQIKILISSGGENPATYGY